MFTPAGFALFAAIASIGSPAKAQLYENSQHQAIEEGFKKIDIDGDGQYDLKEWWKMYQRDLRTAVESDLTRLILAKDKNVDGYLSLEEYLDTPDDIMQTKDFNESDEDKDGLVSLDEIMAFSDRLNAEKGYDIITKIDANQDDIVEWQEYYSFTSKMLLNH